MLTGRPNGVRRSVLKQLFGQSDSDTGPGSAYAAPDYSTDGVAVGGSNKMEPPRNVTPPEGFEVVMHKAALNSGEMAELNVAGRMIIMVKINEDYFALDSSCPHAQAPLVDGELTDGVIVSPYHGWQYNVVDGSCLNHDALSVKTYETVVKSEAVCVKV